MVGMEEKEMFIVQGNLKLSPGSQLGHECKQMGRVLNMGVLMLFPERQEWYVWYLQTSWHYPES